MRQVCGSRHTLFIVVFAGFATLVGSASSAPGQVVWTEHQKLVPSDGDASSRRFGWAVAIDGDYIAVGAPWDETSPGSNDTGAVYVFRRIGSSWVEQQKLKVAGLHGEPHLGRAVAIEGDVIVAGVPHDYLDDVRPGEAYVFRRNGSTWTQEARLVPSGSAQEDGFGLSLSISGDRIVVGAPISTFIASEPGSAYVFRHEGGNWIEEGALLAADGEAGDGFGTAVSIDGDEIVVGAPWSDDACTTDPNCNSGSAYLFGFNGSTWTQEDKLVADDTAESGKFGASVWNGPGRIFVGAESASTVYVLMDTGGSWAEEARLTPSHPVTYFGHSIDVASDQVLVGAPISGSGAAFLFSHDGVAWTQTAKLLTSDGDSVHQLGLSVSLSSDVAVVGSDSGGAYVYSPVRIPAVSQWGLVVLGLLVLVAATLRLRRVTHSRRDSGCAAATPVLMTLLLHSNQFRGGQVMRWTRLGLRMLGAPASCGSVKVTPCRLVNRGSVRRYHVALGVSRLLWTLPG